MINKIDWFFRFVRIAGAYFPASAVCLQFQAEVDAIEVNRRLNNLEDPISLIHDKSYELCQYLYTGLVNGEYERVDLSEEFFVEFNRPLAVFESKGYLKKRMSIGSKYASGVKLIDPSFVVYLGRKFANPVSMAELYDLVENCELGISIDGMQLSSSLDIPLSVVRSLFEVYENNGFGLLSKTLGTCNYRAIG